MANVTTLKPGDLFPENVTFQNQRHKICGIPAPYHASDEWANKKVVLVSVPGAFMRTCSGAHLPSYIKNLSKIKEKGVDIVAFIAYNDAYVMSARGKANDVEGKDILFLSDPMASFLKSIGWSEVLGLRGRRYAIVVDHGKIVFEQRESGKGTIEASGAEAVLPIL
ncbi:Redoxin [Talaromyces proteolyticus]|uniref:Redoxin n=1 Tax=Talaromyces proteolyticus TaxID=1131652 RepID=A0AAD4PUQ9_9EURO|nr:Redoxin [Talaromyces proteolyticus]KAH8690444.1 Redoxin [Talaromyces proteolyticus]